MAATMDAKNLGKRYDDLVLDIFEQLKKVLGDLNRIKRREKEEWRIHVKSAYTSQLRRITVKKRQSRLNLVPPVRKAIKGLMREGGGTRHAYTDEYFKEIRPLEEEFMKIMKEEVEINSGVVRTYMQVEQKLSEDIKYIEEVLNYIGQSIGKKKDNKKRRNLDTKGIKKRLELVFNIATNSRAAEAMATKRTVIKDKIEHDAEEIIRKLEQLYHQGT